MHLSSGRNHIISSLLNPTCTRCTMMHLLGAGFEQAEGHVLRMWEMPLQNKDFLNENRAPNKMLQHEFNNYYSRINGMKHELHSSAPDLVRDAAGCVE